MNHSNDVCACPDCVRLQANKVSEYDLHLFVGELEANSECDLGAFERGLLYSGVMHWDVGYTGEARYFIYCDESGKMTAWYDRETMRGYK